MSGLRQRTPTALAYGALLLVPLLLGPRWFAVVIGALGALAYVELVRLFRARAAGPALVGLALVLIFTIPRILVGREILLDIGILALGVVAAAVGVAATGVPLLARLGFTVAGAVYLGWVFGYLSDLAWAGSFYTSGRVPESFPTWLLVAVAATWASDVAAYLVGSAIGRRKLAPRISPGKTWEGTIAGFIGAAIVVVGTAALAGMPASSTIFLALAIGPAGLGGDLLESFLKRRVGAKDSGTLFPGHGGAFDRIDSLVTVAPVAAVAVFLAGTLG